MTRRTFLTLALVILAGAGLLRFVWLTSDPPTVNSVGVVWHDEGAWTHNARNKALWGVWRTDNWNPVYIAPVFTALEYASFRAFGVGTRQARVVPAASGLVAVAFLMAGLTATAGRKTALAGGALLAVNYVWVMWNRAALIESTMTAFIVISWGAYALAGRRPLWGLVAGASAMLAFFTKASAAFFLVAIVLEPLTTRTPSSDRRGARRTWLGVAIAGAAVGLVFVVPHWSELRFYNWQMSVTRKPEYTLGAFETRASWLPLVHDFLTWMWPLFVAACAGLVGTVIRWRSARPPERLLVLWVLVGLLELVMHDSGNERRYVMFIPPLAALASIWLVPAEVGAQMPREGRLTRSIAAIVALGLGYLAAGSLVRLFFLDDVRAGRLHATVVISAAAAALVAAVVYAAWRRAQKMIVFGGHLLPGAIRAGILIVPVAIDGAHVAGWARTRQTLNYEASLEVGRLLPPGTLVQGKLANGLALENRIRPIFIGHQFGNYADRLQRDDVRYILTYVSPSVGYESQAGSGLIQEVLDRYPRHRTVATFPVDETGGPDRAALFDKFPGTDRRAPD